MNGLKSTDVDMPGRKRLWGRNLLVVAQVAMSLMLLTASFLMVRGFQHALVENAGFNKDHANVKEYRHSLTEEASALRAVAEIAAKDQAAGQLKTSDPSLDNLIRLYKADLIEAYILFVRLDEGIARDYADYRRANREKLHRYWNEFVIAKQRGF